MGVAHINGCWLKRKWLTSSRRCVQWYYAFKLWKSHLNISVSSRILSEVVEKMGYSQVSVKESLRVKKLLYLSSEVNEYYGTSLPLNGQWVFSITPPYTHSLPHTYTPTFILPPPPHTHTHTPTHSHLLPHTHTHTHTIDNILVCSLHVLVHTVISCHNGVYSDVHVSINTDYLMFLFNP